MRNKKYYEVDGKKIDILKEKWDFLLLLDACRFDYFKDVVREFFKDGVLKKAISPATWTIEWLNKVFGEKYYEDIIYISPHPFINSQKRVCYRQWDGDLRCFDGKKHFFKVVDVWRHETLKYVKTPIHPILVNRAFHKTYIKYPNKRYILHYIQPHRPYVTIKDELNPEEYSFSTRVFNTFLSPIQTWELRRFLNRPPSSALEECYRKEGKKGIIKVYKNEIRLVLERIKMLTEAISGDWLIISDHGERLTNFWRWNSLSHGGRPDKDVIEVPWFEIKS